ncbi:MAG: type II toxin-antitoxin system HicB family antitoxin [Rhodanobacteraceae bacterium]
MSNLLESEDATAEQRRVTWTFPAHRISVSAWQPCAILKHTAQRFATARRGPPLMEHIVNLHIDKLPEGMYLATSDDVPGLLAQGRTVAETLEIARDVAKRLIEAQRERTPQTAHLAPVRQSFDYPLILR